MEIVALQLHQLRDPQGTRIEQFEDGLIAQLQPVIPGVCLGVEELLRHIDPQPIGKMLFALGHGQAATRIYNLWILLAQPAEPGAQGSKAAAQTAHRHPSLVFAEQEMTKLRGLDVGQGRDLFRGEKRLPQLQILAVGDDGAGGQARRGAL